MNWWDKPKYDLSEKTFGRLTAKSMLPSKGRRRWLCLCECGNTTEVAANNLTQGKVVSCGCALKGCNKKRPYESKGDRFTYDEWMKIGAVIRAFAP